MKGHVPEGIKIRRIEKNIRYFVIDTQPDSFGRQRFTMFWMTEDSHYNEGSKEREATAIRNESGQVIGYGKAQVFFAQLNDHFRIGDKIGLPPWRQA